MQETTLLVNISWIQQVCQISCWKLKVHLVKRTKAISNILAVTKENLYLSQILKNWKQWYIFFFPWAPKLLWTVTAAMKLEDTCSLEGKLWQTAY